MAGDPRDVRLRQRYALAGAPYGAAETGFDRWCDELEDASFDRPSRDPRRMAPPPADGAHDPNRVVVPR